MKILTILSEMGAPIHTTPICEGGDFLIVTPKARKFLRDKLVEMKSRCKDCNIFARSDELENERCKADVGCNSDTSLRKLIAMTDGQAQYLAMSKIISDAQLRFAKFVVAADALLEQAASEDEPEKPEPDKDDKPEIDTDPFKSW